MQSDASRYSWYHCIEIDGCVTDGDYDLRPLLPQYGFPDDMRGLKALDVGRGSGFFAFEFEKRGANVVATDLGSVLEWDFVGFGERDRYEGKLGDSAAWTDRHLTGAFHFAKNALRSRVQDRIANVYDLAPETFGTFDIVFAGSITSHLRDPALAFQRLRSVTRGKLILAAPSVVIEGAEHLPLMMLIGAADDDRRSWWVMNERCLVNLLKVSGFGAVKIVARPKLVNRRTGQEIAHVIAHAFASV